MTNQHPPPPPGPGDQPPQNPADPFGAGQWSAPPPGGMPPQQPQQPGMPPAGMPQSGMPPEHAAPGSPLEAGPGMPGGAVPPPGDGQPGIPQWQPPPKKSKTGLIIGIVVAVLLVAGGGVGVYLWQPWNASASDSTADSNESQDDDSQGEDDSGDAGSQEGEPSAVLEEAWFAPDWETAKTYMCADYAQQLEDNGSAETYAPPPPDEEFQVVNEDIADDTAEVTVETTVAADEGPTSGEVLVSMEIEEDEWRICQIAPAE